MKNTFKCAKCNIDKNPPILFLSNMGTVNSNKSTISSYMEIPFNIKTKEFNKSGASFITYIRDKFKPGDVVTYMSLPNHLRVIIVDIEESVEDDGSVSWHNFIGYCPLFKKYVTFKYHNIKEAVDGKYGEDEDEDNN